MIWEYGVYDDSEHKYEQTNTQWYMRKFCLDHGDPEVKIIELSHKWNFTGPMRVFHGPFRKRAYVIHYAGKGLFHGKSRLKQMENDYHHFYRDMPEKSKS